jgi:hypothetical protein
MHGYGVTIPCYLGLAVLIPLEDYGSFSKPFACSFACLVIACIPFIVLFNVPLVFFDIAADLTSAEPTFSATVTIKFGRRSLQFTDFCQRSSTYHYEANLVHEHLISVTRNVDAYRGAPCFRDKLEAAGVSIFR